MVDTHEHKGSRQDMASVALRSTCSFSYPTAAESSALAFAFRVGEADPTGARKPRLLDRVRAAIRARHYSRRTEKAATSSSTTSATPPTWGRPKSRAS